MTLEMVTIILSKHKFMFSDRQYPINVDHQNSAKSWTGYNVNLVKIIGANVSSQAQVVNIWYPDYFWDIRVTDLTGLECQNVETMPMKLSNCCALVWTFAKSLKDSGEKSLESCLSRCHLYPQGKFAKYIWKTSMEMKFRKLLDLKTRELGGFNQYNSLDHFSQSHQFKHLFF